MFKSDIFLLKKSLITDQQITLQLQETITSSFQAFLEILLKTFNLNPNLGQLPIKVSKSY